MKFLCSYSFKFPGLPERWGFGNCEATLPVEISMDAVRELEKKIKEDGGYSGAVVLNLVKLDALA